MQDESNPLNLLATMAGWAQQAQTALFTMSAPSTADGTAASQASLQAGMPLPHKPHARLALQLQLRKVRAQMCWVAACSAAQMASNACAWVLTMPPHQRQTAWWTAAC